MSAPTDPLVTTEAHAGASPVVPVVLASIDANATGTTGDAPAWASVVQIGNF